MCVLQIDGRPRINCMRGRVNHRGWIVLTSVTSDDNSMCVDFFEGSEGGFGFEHLRADPEDAGHWTAVGGFERARFESIPDAVDAAAGAIYWLNQSPRARAAVEGWMRRVASERP